MLDSLKFCVICRVVTTFQRANPQTGSILQGIFFVSTRVSKRETSFRTDTSLGFFGTAVLDGYHCLATTTAFAYLFPSSIESLVPWSWHASRTYLSFYVCLALWVNGKRELKRNQVAKIATASAVILTVSCFVFFAFYPLPRAYFSSALGGRPQEYVPALFFLVALIGHLRSNRWKTSCLEHWYIKSLIVGIATQAVFMSQSHAILDCMFDLAHVLKIVTYALVGTGLTLSMSDFFRGAEDAKLLAFAVEHTQYGVAILNPNSKIDFVNEGFEKITGHSRSDVVGQKIQDVLSEPNSHDEGWGRISRSCHVGTGCELELQCTVRSGDPIWVSAELCPVVKANDQASEFILFFRDVTQQRLVEKEKAKLNEELLAVSRKAGMSEIATGTLHNVGNVLNSVNVSVTVLRENIRGGSLQYMNRMVDIIKSQDDFVEFVAADPRGKNLPGALQDIVQRLNNEQGGNERELRSLADNIEHIKQIVSMQQTFAKVGGVMERLDVVDLAHDAIKMREAGIARSHVNVVWEIGSDIPQVSTDRHKVIQILVNFIGNAIQAMASNHQDSRKLIISIQFEQDEVNIHVRDNGHGISAANLSNIFKHGFTTKPEGHGFGLHSSALAAQELGGSLSVQSEGEGNGATFTLRLPVLETPAHKGNENEPDHNAELIATYNNAVV